MASKLISEDILINELSEVTKHLNVIWDETGISDDERNDKMGGIKEKLLNTIRGIEDSEVKLRDSLVRSIDETGLKLYHMTNDLKVPNVTEPAVNLTLLELDKFLKEQLIYYEEESRKRIRILSDLQEKEKDICNQLGEDAQVLPPDRIPTKETIDLMQKVIKSLESECEHRQRNFSSLKASISFYMDELELTASDINEKDLVFGVADFVILSQENIKKLKSLSTNLQQKVQEEKERESRMKERVQVLYDRLNIDEENRRIFRSSLTCCTARNNRMLEAVLEDLEELKRQNLGRFVNQLRLELETWWDKCYISEDEKEGFAPFFSENYTEDVLEAHEKEVRRLKRFYEDNEVLFLKIQKWQKLWKKVSELEEKAQNPARLFGNRGCALLQEEKERKRVNLELPRVEIDINENIKRWESENGRPFLVNGKSLTNFISSHWENFNQNKNNEKEMRHNLRSKQIQEEALLGAVRRTPQRKRNMMHQDVKTSKYLRTNSSERAPNSLTASTFGSISGAGSKLRVRNRTASAKSKPVRKHRGQISNPNISDETSYDQFSDGIHVLSEREVMRSSIAPQITFSSCKSPKRPKGLPTTPSSSSRYLRTTLQSASSRRQPLTPTTNYTPSSSSRYLRPTLHSATSRRQPLTPTTCYYGNQMKPSTPNIASNLPRRSSRLNVSKNHVSASRSRISPRNRTSNLPYSSSRLTTPIRNKLSFLI